MERTLNFISVLISYVLLCPILKSCLTQNILESTKQNARDGDVRLVGAFTEYEGRVEFYHFGGWGTICDDGWNIADAEVVCNQLGFPGALAAVGNAYYGLGDTIMILDDVSCDGTEHYLAECRHGGLFNSNCDQRESAGVLCKMPDVHYPRLVNGSTRYEGRIEVWDGDQWTKLCSNGHFYNNEGNAVCKELGFDEVDYFANDDRFGDGNVTPSNVIYSCSRDENSLSECKNYPFRGTSCSTSVLKCRNKEQLSIGAIAVIALGGVIVVVTCLCCVCSLYKSLKSSKRTSHDVTTNRTTDNARPVTQRNEQPATVSMNIPGDAPPSYEIATSFT